MVQSDNATEPYLAVLAVAVHVHHHLLGVEDVADGAAVAREPLTVGVLVGQAMALRPPVRRSWRTLRSPPVRRLAMGHC